MFLKLKSVTGKIKLVKIKLEGLKYRLYTKWYRCLSNSHGGASSSQMIEYPPKNVKGHVLRRIWGQQKECF